MYDWKKFLTTCRNVLGKGAIDPKYSESWCAYTTFSSLEHGIHYWHMGFPNNDELLENNTLDGGLWRQSFRYENLAHVIVPATFYWESNENNKFESGFKSQNLGQLSNALGQEGLPFRKTELLLEVKLY